MLEFGFYEKEITPPLGSGIPGYFNVRRGTNVLDRLYARAMVVGDGDEKIAIVSIDGLAPLKSVVDSICARVEAYTGIARKNVLVAYTHSHTAIPYRQSGLVYEDDETVSDSVKGFLDVHSRIIADCVTLADMRLKKGVAKFGMGEVGGISFCRNYIMKNSTPQTNPPRQSPDIVGPVAETDNELPVLFITDEKGSPLGALTGFACHADCIGGEELSGDYISALSGELKRIYGEDFVTVFLLGCCGDINHFDVSKSSDSPDHYVMMGKKIAEEVVKTAEISAELKNEKLYSSFEYISIPRIAVEEERVSYAKHMIETVRPLEGVRLAADNTDPEQYNLAMSKRLMDFLESAPDNYVVPLQCLQIGEFTVYGFNSEIFSEFGKIVKKGDGTGINLVATECNEAFGYVPTRDMFCDTIYESRPGSCCLDKEAGYIMAEKLISMKK